MRQQKQITAKANATTKTDASKQTIAAAAADHNKKQMQRKPTQCSSSGGCDNKAKLPKQMQQTTRNYKTDAAESNAIAAAADDATIKQTQPS
jgi:hypothetical protein